MRPWERESDTSPPDSPLPKPKTSLSSLVVRPSPESGVGGSDLEGGNLDFDAEMLRCSEVQRESERRHRDHLSDSPPRRGRSRRLADGLGLNHPEGLDNYKAEFSSGSDDSRFRDVTPPIYQHGRDKRNHRDVSPSYGRGRGGGRFHDHSPTYGRGNGGERFREPTYDRGRDRGGGRFYGFPTTQGHQEDRERFLDFSPTYERDWGGERFREFPVTFEGERDEERFRDHSHVFGRERNGRRYRDISPLHANERDARMFEGDFDGGELEPLPFRDEGAIRNNPNMARREGDWFCKNPLCYNLNFARREYCFNCSNHRYGSGHGTSAGRRQKAPQNMQHISDNGPQREGSGCRSPPHYWARDGPRERRDFVPERGGRFPATDSPVPRDRLYYNEDYVSREYDKFGGVLTRRPRGRGRGRGGGRGRGRGRGRGSYSLGHERRGYDRDDPWIQDPRERSRSPGRFEPLARDYPRVSFTSRGRGRGDWRGMGK